MTTTLGSIHAGLPMRTPALGAMPARGGVGASADATLDFARVLGTSDRGLAGRAAASPQDKARQAAEEFVSITLVQPLLKMAREANTSSAPFGPGEGEDAFGGLLDASYAQEIVRAAQFPLVDRLARDMLDRSAPRHAEVPATDARDARSTDSVHTGMEG